MADGVDAVGCSDAAAAANDGNYGGKEDSALVAVGDNFPDNNDYNNN